MVKEKITYITIDGKEFNDNHEAVMYECKVFLRDYLLENTPLSEYTIDLVIIPYLNIIIRGTYEYNIIHVNQELKELIEENEEMYKNLVY